MRKIVMYCDRCKKEFEKWNHKKPEIYCVAEFVHDDGDPYLNEPKDLCESCYTEFENWWNFTPQHKIGRWIYDYTSADGHRTYHCSECGCYLKPKHSEPLNSFKWCNSCGAKMEEIKADVIKQTRWIPCSEEMPKLDEEACSEDVLILLRETTWDIDECREVHITKIAYYDDNAISSDGIYMDTEGWVLRNGSTLTTDEVISWMPLPESYKIERDK